MPGDTFRIIELNPGGGAEPPGFPIVFEWTAANRNIPERPWTFGIKQRTMRTDYPGGDDPTEQVLGPNFTPFTLTGRFDDRYNPLAAANPDLGPEANREVINGYARAEMERLETLVRRGNPVRITFENITIQGIITDLEFQYMRRSLVRYSFTMSPHHRAPVGFFSIRRSPRGVLNADQLRDDVSRVLNAMLERHARAPVARISGDLYIDVDQGVRNIQSLIERVNDSIEQRNVSETREANLALLEIGSRFLEVVTAANDIKNMFRDRTTLNSLDFDDSAIDVLNFNVWAKYMSSLAREMIVVANRSASQVAERAEPRALALYRPSSGEHLYEISTRFYQTPYSWQLIYERNGLTSTVLNGSELLIIPESTAR